LKQLLCKATQVNKDTKRDIDKTIYGIVLYQTGKNKMEQKTITSWSITDAYPEKLLYHVHMLLHHTPESQQKNTDSNTCTYRNVIQCIIFMETTRAAQLVISNMDRTKPFSLTNSVCNNPPNTYHEYTLESFIKKIDDKMKEHLFYKLIQEVFKNYLENNLSDCTLRQEQTNYIVNAGSTADSSLTLQSPP
jgi:hypothetical protein